MDITQTSQGMDINLSKADLIELQDFFMHSAAMTFGAIPLRFSLPVRITHIPINLEELCGKQYQVFGALFCNGKKPSHIELDFRFVLECWHKKNPARIAVVLCHEAAHAVIRNHSAAHGALFKFLALTVLFRWMRPKSYSELTEVLSTATRLINELSSGGEILCTESMLVAQFYKPGEQLPSSLCLR
jgi:hypothetical protein